MASLVFDHEDAEEKLLAQALFVNDVDLGDEDDLLEQPPATGEEYLRKVVREANKLKFATTAENADQLLNKAPEQPTHVDRRKTDISENLLPTKEWQSEQVKKFTKVRLKLARHLALVKISDNSSDTQKFPSAKNEYGWCTFCLGNEFWKKLKAAEEKDSSENEEKSIDKVKKSYAQSSGLGHPPILQIISNMKQSIITRLIEKHADWASTLEEIDVNLALWFYSLMSVVEKPLHPDIESSMRSFVLVCSKQRSRQNNRKTRELDLIICFEITFSNAIS